MEVRTQHSTSAGALRWMEALCLVAEIAQEIRVCLERLLAVASRLAWAPLLALGTGYP